MAIIIDKIDHPVIFLITGIMASGKSTIAQLLAERFERAVHVRGDLFRRMIVSGREEMMQETSAEAQRQLRLRYQLAVATADAYHEAGFTVVVQDIIIGPMLTEVIHMIRRRPLYVVVLCPNQKVIAEREMNRSKKGYGEWSIDVLDRELREQTDHLGLWIDTSAQTPDETVEEILRRAPAEALIR